MYTSEVLNVILGKEANTVEPSTGIICKPAHIETTFKLVYSSNVCGKFTLI